MEKFKPYRASGPLRALKILPAYVQEAGVNSAQKQPNRSSGDNTDGPN